MNLIRSFFKVFFLFPLYYVARYTAACAGTLGPPSYYRATSTRLQSGL